MYSTMEDDDPHWLTQPAVLWYRPFECVPSADLKANRFINATVRLAIWFGLVLAAVSQSFLPLLLPLAYCIYLWWDATMHPIVSPEPTTRHGTRPSRGGCRVGDTMRFRNGGGTGRPVDVATTKPTGLSSNIPLEDQVEDAQDTQTRINRGVMRRTLNPTFYEYDESAFRREMRKQFQQDAEQYARDTTVSNLPEK